MSDAEIETYPRSVFLEATTLGIGALIGGIVTVPAIGFMVAPAFVNQHPKKVDLGPIDNFDENQFVIATFMRDPAQGEVSRRTAYIRNNGPTDKRPELHDHLEPLRAPRLPRAAERADPQRQEKKQRTPVASR